MLRLLVLLSITNNGLPKKHFDYFRCNHISPAKCPHSCFFLCSNFSTLQIECSWGSNVVIFGMEEYAWICFLVNFLVVAKWASFLLGFPGGKEEFLMCKLLNWWLTWSQLRYSFCRREVLHSYGFEHMFTLSNLEKVGLLTKQVCFSSSWKIVCRYITFQKIVKLYLLRIGLYWLIPATLTFYTYGLNVIFYYIAGGKE